MFSVALYVFFRSSFSLLHAFTSNVLSFLHSSISHDVLFYSCFHYPNSQALSPSVKCFVNSHTYLYILCKSDVRLTYRRTGCTW